MQKLKSFWRSSNILQSSTSTQTKQQSSLLDHASNLIYAYRKTPVSLTASEFQEYLSIIPEEFKKFKKNQLKGKQTSTGKVLYQSIKSQLIRRVYENVSRQYFATDFLITGDFFPSAKRANRQKQQSIHQNLDEVQVALFNQITARFDEILSALRTVQSLQCLVNQNIFKIKNIRHNILANTKKVTEKQIKIITITNKRDRLIQSISKLERLKLYNQFLSRQSTAKQHQFNKSSTTLVYDSIKKIKKQMSFFTQFKCCLQLDTLIQSSEFDLKRSFSENLNGLFYEYVVGKISPYYKGFWDKFRFANILIEEEGKKQGQSMLLDESGIIEEDQPIIKDVKLTLNEQNEEIILKCIARGWNQGEYTVGGLKSQIEKYIKQLNSSFQDDMRIFCVQFLKHSNIQISNPSLDNMLSHFNLTFFTKTCSFYSTLFQNILFKLCSITKKNVKYVLDITVTYVQPKFKNAQFQQKILQDQYSKDTNETEQNYLTIEKKQKLTQIIDGILNVFNFVCKSIIDKFKQMLQLFQIHETNSLADFKIFIMVIQNMQDFLITKIFGKFNQLICPPQSFLYPKFTQMKLILPINDLSDYKKAKLIQYLSKMHKNAVTVQLRQSLQDQIWQQQDIPTFYYDTLHYITSGESINLRSKYEVQLKANRKQRMNESKMMNNQYDSSVLMNSMMDSMFYEQSRMKDQVSNVVSTFRIIRSQIQIQNQIYRVTSTLLLLLEMIEDYMLLRQFYPEIEEEIALKLSQTLRSYNSSSFQLIVHAGAVSLGKIKTKSITAKQLALNGSCLRFLLYIMNCIKNRIKLNDFNNLYKQVEDHFEQTIKKLETILMSKIIQSIPEIKLQSSPSKGTQQIVNYCRIVHGILIQFFKADILKKVFHGQITKQYLAKISSIKVQNKTQAQTLKDDVNFFFYQLRFLNQLVDRFKQSNTEALNVVKAAFQSL